MDDRIITRLTSGLGNQLFQLAHGMWLSKARSAELRFDTTWFILFSAFQPEKRHLSISGFNIEFPEEFNGLRRWLVGLMAGLYGRSRLAYRGLEAIGKLKLVRDRQDHRVMSLDARHGACRLYLDGYWQTREPFLHIRNHLLPKLVPRKPLCEAAKSIVDSNAQTPTGFIHVRRGDYIKIGGERSALPLRYYQNAMQVLRSEGVLMEKWLVFTDDLEWSRRNLSFIRNIQFVDYYSANRDVEDLMIMKTCAAGIIANSSYSWWAAALGSASGRPIIAPDRYWPSYPLLAERWSLPDWQHVTAWS